MRLALVQNYGVWEVSALRPKCVTKGGFFR